MNLNNMRYGDYIQEIAITIADDIEGDVNSYSKEEKEDFIERLNNEDYYELQEWIQSYLNDINIEIMTLLSKKLGFEY